MDLRISSIEISGFRGIPNTQILDFCRGRKNPASLVICGDNGTGKSSITDAFEFVLQAKMGRKPISAKGDIPFAVNYLRPEKCEVTAKFNDGTSITRNILKNNEREWITDRYPHPDFSISPIVLRRADILKFWNTPELERQKVFFDFLIDYQDNKTSELEELDGLVESRLTLKTRRRDLGAQLAEILGVDKGEVPLGLKTFDIFVREVLNKKQTRRQLYYLEHQGMDPRVDELVCDIREVSSQIADLNGTIGRIKSGPVTRPEKPVLKQVLAGASQSITEAFIRISQVNSFVDSIEVIEGIRSEISLTTRVILKNGIQTTPEKIFSEANLDLLAFIIFLSLAKESANRGQPKFLILDDILQSIDASIRVRVIEYLVDEFSEWQFIFTVHDRLWLEQLRTLLNQNKFRFYEAEIIRWQFDVGPVININNKDLTQPLLKAVNDGDILGICSQAGLLLENICYVLSYSLPISVIRRKGDKYSLGDVWPGIYKILSRTNCANAVENISRWQYLRNIVGAHYNEWAKSLSISEAQQFGEAVYQLLREVRCEDCFSWIDRNGETDNKPRWSCRCGKIVINYKR